MVVSSATSCFNPLLHDYEHVQKDDCSKDDVFQFSQTNETEHEDEDEDEDDDADALSLCDLPIYSSSSSSSSDLKYQEAADTVFEFVSLSGELSSCKSSFHHEDDDAIIFCGKLIAYKDDADAVVKPRCEKASPRHSRVKDGEMKRNKRALFSWKRLKIASFRKKKTSTENSSPRKKKAKASAIGLEKISSVKKVSTLLTSPTKSRWYLFLFGQTRFPQAMTMDLSDLKNRQRSRCSPSPSVNLRAVAEGGAEEVGGSCRGKGIWSLLKESVTTVSRRSADDVVRAVGCISLV